MNTDNTIRPSAGRGIIVAVIASLVPVYWLGIGGSLVAATFGVVATLIICNLLGKSAQEAQHAEEGSAQLVGVLDSSQLGADYDVLDRDRTQSGLQRRTGSIIVVASLVATLVAAGGVQIATEGRGIHFYLGSWSLPNLFAPADKTSTKDAESQTRDEEATSSQSTGSEQTYSVPTSSQDETQDTQTQPSASEDQGSQTTPQAETTPQEESTPAQEGDDAPTDATDTIPQQETSQQETTAPDATPSADAGAQQE